MSVIPPNQSQVRADIIQENTRYLNFSNIRYAAPPLGALRFNAPAPPINNRSAGVQDGSFGPHCSQANPAWSPSALSPVSSNVGSENCLFLDLIVSNDIFNSNDSGRAPVIVWIYGGGFVLGSKETSGDPIALLERSREFNEEAVWVAMNYRVRPLSRFTGTLE